MAVLQCRIRKIRLPNLARDESSDDDSVNCSEISAVTWFGITSDDHIDDNHYIFKDGDDDLMMMMLNIMMMNLCI